MKSKITKLAAAAIIIAFMLITYLGNVTLDLTSTAFAQMTEAMKKKPWLHAISQFYGDQEMKWSESWYSFAQKIVARKDTDGTASYLDLLNNKEYIYNPTTDIVTVTYRPNDNADLILRSESPWKVVETMIETFEAQGAVHKCRNGQYQSKDVYIYDLIMSEKSHGKAEIKIISDRDKNLLLVWEVKSWNPQRELITDAKVSFDYPEKGPEDIYELGVPKTAKVIDNSPTHELLEVLETYQACRENIPSRYIMIVVDGIPTAEIFYNNNQQQRMEKYKSYDVRKFSQERENIILGMGKTFDSQLKWWTQPALSKYGIRLRGLEIYDGEFFYRLEENDVELTIAEKRRPSRKPALGQDLVRIGWPKHPLSTTYKVTKVAIVEDDYSKDNDLICIEMLRDGLRLKNKVTSLSARWRFYLNPKRDYICHKREFNYRLKAPWQSDPNWLDGIDLENVEKDTSYISEVKEYGRTASGKWYPKKIENRRLEFKEDGTTKESISIDTIYLNENPQFPDGIFDPENLPKAND